MKKYISLVLGSFHENSWYDLTMYFIIILYFKLSVTKDFFFMLIKNKVFLRA